MPRRISDYPDAFAGWNLVSSFGSIISVIATGLFLYVLYAQLVEGKESARNPWVTPEFYIDHLQALLNKTFDSLEWNLTSPPKPHSFTSLPLQSFFCTARLLTPPKRPIEKVIYSKDIHDQEKELMVPGENGTLVARDLTYEYLDFPVGLRAEYIEICKQMQVHLRKGSEYSKQANQKYDYNREKTDAMIENTPSFKSKHLTMVNNHDESCRLQEKRDIMEKAAKVKYDNYVPGQGSWIEHIPGKRKERTESGTPDLEPKKPKLDIAEQAMAKNPRFSASSMLDKYEVEQLVFASCFGYLSSVNLDIISPLIYSPCFPIVSIAFLLFLQFIWVIYLYIGEKKSKNALFKSSKKNGKT